MTRRLVILADDFTGACDSAAPFGGSRPTVVVHDLAALPSLLAGNDDAVVAVDLDLRERSDASARELCAAGAERTLALAPDAQLFVKIDSTLRGPIAGLVDGALRGSGLAVAVIAPAFPEQGRLLEAGRLVLDGRRGANLTDILGLERTAVLSAAFARTVDEVERAVEHACLRGARRIIVDADDSSSLISIAEAWPRHPDWLLVGSAGLARQLARSSSAPQAGRTAQPAPTGEGPILVVAGSPALATRRQLARLEATSVPDAVILATPSTDVRDQGEAARGLAEIVATWAVRSRPRAVILAGGATAREVCQQLHASGVRLNGELQPGIPTGVLEGGPWAGIAVVTKAGGFGDEDALLDAVRALGVSSTPDG